MTIQKIRSGRINTVIAENHVADVGTIFYNEHLGDLRLGDGVTPGGRLLNLGGSTGSTYTLPVASGTVLGGIKVGENLSISPDGTLSAVTTASGTANAFSTFYVAGQSSLVATGPQTLEFVAGLGVKITTNASALPYKTMTLETDMFNATLDGGTPVSVYGGLTVVDGGGV